MQGETDGKADLTGKSFSVLFQGIAGSSDTEFQVSFLTSVYVFKPHWKLVPVGLASKPGQTQNNH